MSKELKEKITAAKAELEQLAKLLDLPAKRKELDALKQKSQGDSFWNDQKTAQKTMKQADTLADLLQQWGRYEKNLEDAEVALELLEEEQSVELAKEVTEKLGQVEQGIEALKLKRMLSGEQDGASAILFINAGAGGTEACDWAEILLRMYRRWCEQQGYRNEVIDFTPGDGAGFRSVVMTVEGNYAYGYLKAEIGVHRLVRISPFDANKRRHTSFASVFVLPDVEEDIEIDIKEADLKVDTFKSGGAGGQHVNKTESAVRITHIPSGIIVACQSQRSQHQNRATAMKVLKAKLYEVEMEKQLKERESLAKSKKKIEWGSQIRSYVLQPYRLIKDHRTQLEVGNVDAVLDGDLNPFIQKYLLECQ